MRSDRVKFLGFLMLLMLCGCSITPLSFAETRFIYFGSPMLTASQNVTYLDDGAFDGTVLLIPVTSPAGWAHENIMNHVAISQDNFDAMTANVLASTPINSTHNFARLNIVTEDVQYMDWFDDNRWDVALSNLDKYAKVVADSGLEGIFLDNENYVSNKLFRKASLKYQATKTFEEYAAKAKERGQQVIQTINGRLPNAIIVNILGYYFANNWSRCGTYCAPIETDDYGLLRYFIDGLYLGASDGTVIHDGDENYYERTSMVWAARHAERMLKDWPENLSGELAAYKKHIRISFGIWDNPSGTRTVADLQAMSLFAAQLGGGYVWHYNQEAVSSINPNIFTAVRNAKAAMQERCVFKRVRTFKK